MFGRLPAHVPAKAARPDQGEFVFIGLRSQSITLAIQVSFSTAAALFALAVVSVTPKLPGFVVVVVRVHLPGEHDLLAVAQAHDSLRFALGFRPARQQERCQDRDDRMTTIVRST